MPRSGEHCKHATPTKDDRRFTPCYGIYVYVCVLCAAAKHVLRSTDNSTRNIYDKGLVAEVGAALRGGGCSAVGAVQLGC